MRPRRTRGLKSPDLSGRKAVSGHVLDTVFHVIVKHVISPSSLPDFSQSLIAPAVIPRIGNGVIGRSNVAFLREQTRS